MSGIGHRIQYALRLLEEWQAVAVCFVSGAAMALAFAPFYYWWVMPLALPLFYLVLEAAPARRHALRRGFGFGYGYFMAGTYWIANALAVDSAQFGWLIPISILGLSAVMGLWFALFGGVVWWARSGNAPCDVLRFALLWVVLEYLRTLGIFGFPWNLLGYAALASERVAQLASLMGVYGLSLLMMPLALLPVIWLKQNISERARGVYSAAALIALIASYGFGMARMPTQSEMTGTRVRVVQPNIPQSLKWTQDGRLQSLRIHAELSQLQTEAPVPPIIIWSETAMPFTLYPDSVWPARLSGLLPPRSTLITGAVRGDDSGATLQVWNSIVAIDGAGILRASYDKHQLVPFGEFVPLRHILRLNKITPGTTDFSRGPGPQTQAFEDVPPYSPLVCYEIIFPWLAVNEAERPAWIMNATNDAWYGDSPGPYQHFSMSRLRAIEQGLPVVRAANTGISAVIDPYGRPVRSLPLNERGIIDQALPKALEPTFYAKHAETLTLSLMAVLWMFTQLWLWVRKT